MRDASDTFPGYRLAGPLGGRYQVRALIAAGGMAEVYEARDTVLERRVAIKVLHATFGADAEFVERFRREAMSAGRLNHPNIVQVYDWGRSEDGAAYMVMELVEGRTLREILTERGSIPPAEAARIAEQVCKALDVARRSGIVHRDIKPENILIAADGTAKVADFGVARALAESRATQAGVVLGTASYLAPEQVEGHPGDHRSDLYSLGTVLFEMLTGAPPFRGDNPVVVAYRRVAEDVPQLEGIPAELAEAVARATRRNPDERFETASEMAAALSGTAATFVPAPAHEPDRHTRAIPVPSAETQVIRRRVAGSGKRRRRITLLVILLLAGALTPVGIRFFGRVTVPDVSGLTQEAAATTLHKVGLKTDSVVRNHDTIPEGSIISTTPKADERVRRGSTIVMAVSLGPAMVQMPDVRGKSKKEAVDALIRLGIRSTVTLVPHPTVPKDRVIDQSPNAGLQVRRLTIATLTVSTGPEQVVIPNVAGRSSADAKLALEAAGFVVATRTVASETVPRGAVVSTSPAGGTKADRGSAVTMNVSAGPSRFRLPDVRGLQYNRAKAQLESLGLRVGRRQEEDSYGDVVVRTSPRPNTIVNRGDQIILHTA